jgi:putative ABC transport system permease protein
MVLGEWRAHPARVVTAALAIAIGVALGFAVHLVNTSALNEFSQALRTVNGDADLQVRAASPLGFDESAYPRAARVTGVAAASPGVELTAAVGRAGGVTLLGLDALRAADVTPALLARPPGGQAAPGAEVFDPQAVRLSPSALAASGAGVGDEVEISAAGRSARFRITGVLEAVPEGQEIATVDIAAAQWRFGQLGRLQRIDLKLMPGADPDAVRRTLAEVLPADAEAASRETALRRTDSLSRAYRMNLEMLGLVALLTGAFLVYSAQSLSVARRRPQFALLRVLGAPRRALLAQVLAEGLIVGAAGAGAGLALGLGLAEAALRLLGGDLGGGYFGDRRPALVFAPVAAAAFLVLGLTAALAGSLLPARAAARAQAAVALKAVGDAADGPSPAGAWWAAGLLAAGAAAAFAPPIGGVSVFGYLSIGLLLGGGVAAMPWLARLLLTPAQRWAPPWPAMDLALKRLWGAPGQGALALCGIVASTSLMIAMAVMVTSFRGSVEDWLDQILPADLYIRLEGGGGFEPADQARLAQTPGVRQIRFRRIAPLSLSADRPPVALIVGDVDPSAPERDLPLLGRAAVVPSGATPVWVSEPAAWIYRLAPGQRLRLPLGPRGSSEVVVAGIWRDYSRQQGAIALGAADYQRLTGDRLRTEAAVTLKPGVAPDAAAAALRAALPAALRERATIGEPRQIRAAALRIFDRSFAVTYLLEAIAIVVGLTGVAATFAAQTLARTKEFGMLRHVGVMRRQIVAMLATEGAILGAVGAVAGVALGFAMSQVLIHVVNPQSFHWTMQTRAPWGLFAGVAAALVAASAGAALAAGRRALSGDAVRAVREDW